MYSEEAQRTIRIIENEYKIDWNDKEALEKLTQLTLITKEIKDISPLIELKKLTNLNLWDNQIIDISSLRDLINLTNLDLSYNQISDITPLKELKNLIILLLEQNRLVSTVELKNLDNLEELDLGNNQINEIVEVKHLRHLKHLYLENNHITIFPEELLMLNLDIKLKHDLENGILLANNPIEEPPLEIMSQGNEAIREYFERIKKEGKRELNELKVIFIGAGGAGKTSLIKRVLDNEFDKNENMTHGINIRRQKINIKNTEIKVHFWDFGGQEMMHSTHQFFLSHRSLYVIVLDGRKEENVEYWLNFIKSFGGDSPIIIVLNKIDDNRDFELNRKFLKDKYPHILEFFKTSCLDTEGISDFYSYLKKAILDVEMIKTPWVKSWFDVKERIENLNENYIIKDKFNSICDECKVEMSSRAVLSKYLDNLGVAIHFDDFKLDDIHTLNPERITNGIYSIITSKELNDYKGELDISTLSYLLHHETYLKYTHQYIIELMKKFELCYAINDRYILVPSALPKDSPKFEFDESQSLHFEFEYSFLPPSVISTFIVKSHEDIEDRLRWREGVILKDSSTSSRAFIKVDTQDKRIFISVNGKDKRDFFAIIRKRFYDINSKFKEIEITEWIPLPNYPKYRVKYKELKGYEKANRDEYFNGELETSFSVSKLLSGIEKRESRDKSIYIGKYYQGDDMGKTFNAGKDITGVAIGDHNKIDVNITTTNNELENLLNELKAEINQIKAKLSDTDKTKIDKHLVKLEAEINENDEDEVSDRFDKISKIASIVEGAGKILEYKEKIIEFLGFGG